MKTALYARVSTQDQHPENQFRDLREMAKKLKQPYDLYEEKESSANTRPVKQTIIDMTRAGVYNTIVVWMLDRFCRNSLEFLTNTAEFRKLGVRFISLQEHIDTGNDQTPFDTFNTTVRSAMSQLERELTIMRTKEGMKRAKEEGKLVHRPKGAKDKKPRKKFGYFARWEKARQSKKGRGSKIESELLGQAAQDSPVKKDPLIYPGEPCQKT